MKNRWFKLDFSGGFGIRNPPAMLPHSSVSMTGWWAPTWSAAVMQWNGSGTLRKNANARGWVQTPAGSALLRRQHRPSHSAPGCRNSPERGHKFCPKINPKSHFGHLLRKKIAEIAKKNVQSGREKLLGVSWFRYVTINPWPEPKKNLGVRTLFEVTPWGLMLGGGGSEPSPPWDRRG